MTQIAQASSAIRFAKVLSFGDGETTIKIKFALLRGVGLGDREETRPKTLFSWETPRQYNFECANFIVENVCCHCAGSQSCKFSVIPPSALIAVSLLVHYSETLVNLQLLLVVRGEELLCAAAEGVKRFGHAWGRDKSPMSCFSTLVAPYCAIPRDYLSDTPFCALWGFWCLNMANWVRYPLPLF